MTEGTPSRTTDSLPTLRFAEGMLLFTAPPPPGPPGVWFWDPRQNAHSCFAIHYAAMLPAIRQQYAAFQFLPPWTTVTWPRLNLLPLRTNQQDAVAAWLPSRQGVIVMPTGTGKTEVALQLMKELAVPTLIVSPVRDLMYQWHQRILERLGYDAGIVGDNTFNQRPVTVTTYDSAYIHMRDFGDAFQFVIFDECHHLPGITRSEAARMCMAPYRLGLTATPERSDGREVTLDELIGPTVYRRSITQASGTDLAAYDIIRIPVHLLAEERAKYDECSRIIRHHMAVRRQTNPYYSGINLRYESATDPESRRALHAELWKKSIEDRAIEKLRVLEDIFRLHPNTPVLVFTNTKIMARAVSLRFLLPCILNHSRKRERSDFIAGLSSGKYPAIVANRCLDEGVDLPAAKVAVVLGGTASRSQAAQRLGRVIRKKGEQKAALYEVVCGDTKEVHRSRKRRKSDAYARTRHLHL